MTSLILLDYKPICEPGLHRIPFTFQLTDKWVPHYKCLITIIVSLITAPGNDANE